LFSIPTRLALRWLGAIFLLVAILLTVISIKTSWKYALDILLGHTEPYHKGLGPLGLILAITGYLLVPAVIGAVAATFLGRSIERSYRDAAVDEVSKRVLDDLAQKNQQGTG
jgi:hypothetical protein